MSVNLQLYQQQVIEFLRSCTIKFSPIADRMNVVIQNAGGVVDFSDQTTWKYYLNLSGQYHNSDTVMTVTSLDTAQDVDFTPQLLTSSAVMSKAYYIGSPAYLALCQAYPNQVDLIKSIIYPVAVQTAIAADDFTLLGWGDGFLEITEQAAIIAQLQDYISYMSHRWYFGFLSYETYYIWAYWAVFWYCLPNTIFAARYDQLKKSTANSFHIWSYLQSRGLADYSDILTNEQSLFLYRNISYLEQNRGKQSTLVILVNRLLDTLNVGLVGKTIYMNSQTNAAACTWSPEFVSTIIPTNNSQNLEQIAPESLVELNAELINAGLEVNNTLDYINSQEQIISRTPLNIIPTKLVEIQKIGVDQKYGGILNNFLLDTLVYTISSGIYQPIVVVTDPTTALSVSLSGKDALILYYYATQRYSRQTPSRLPILYSPSCAFRPNLNVASIPTSFDRRGYVYPTNEFLSAANIIAGAQYPQNTITDPDIFSTMAANLFEILISYVRYCRTEGNHVALDMFRSYCENNILQTEAYNIELTPATDYTAWFSSVDPNVTAIISRLESASDAIGAYQALCDSITMVLIPANNPVFAFYAYTNASTDNLYDRLRSLFVQLCSYNVAFLDTTRQNALWFLYDPIVYDVIGPISETKVNIDDFIYYRAITQHDMLSLVGIDSSHETCVYSHDYDLITPIDKELVSIVSQSTVCRPVGLTTDYTTAIETDTRQIKYNASQSIFVTSITSGET